MALDRGSVQNGELAVAVGVAPYKGRFGRLFGRLLRGHCGRLGGSLGGLLRGRGGRFKGCLRRLLARLRCADDIGIGGVALIVAEIHAAEQHRFAVGVHDIALCGVVVKGAVERAGTVLIIRKARGRRDGRHMEHQARGAALVGKVHPVAQVDVRVPGEPDHVAVLLDELFEAQVVRILRCGGHRAAVGGITAVVTRTVAVDQRVLDQEDAVTVAAVAAQQILEPRDLFVREFVALGGGVSRLQRHKDKVIAADGLGQRIIRAAVSHRGGGAVQPRGDDVLLHPADGITVAVSGVAHLVVADRLIHGTVVVGSGKHPLVLEPLERRAGGVGDLVARSDDKVRWTRGGDVQRTGKARRRVGIIDVRAAVLAVDMDIRQHLTAVQAIAFGIGKALVRGYGARRSLGAAGCGDSDQSGRSHRDRDALAESISAAAARYGYIGDRIPAVECSGFIRPVQQIVAVGSGQRDRALGIARAGAVGAGKDIFHFRFLRVHHDQRPRYHQNCGKYHA